MGPSRFFVLGAVLAMGGCAAAAAQSPANPFADCEAGLPERPGGEAAARCFADIAMRAAKLRDEARQRLRGHLDRYPEEPWLAYQLGLLSSYSPEALELLEQARDRFIAAEDAMGALLAQLDLVLELDRQQHLSRARDELTIAREMPLPAEDPFMPVRFDLVEATLRTSEGDLKNALDTLLQVERQVVPKAPLDLQEGCFYRLGYVLFELGRYGSSEDYYTKAQEIYRARGNSYRQAASLYMAASLGLLQAPGEDSRDLFIDRFEEVLDLAVESGHTVAEAKAHLELGRLVRDTAAARRHLESCLALEEKVDSLTHVIGLAALARRRASEATEAARELMGRALSRALAADDDPWIMAYLAADRLAVSWATASPEEAVAESLEMLTYIEALRDSQLDDTSKAEVFSVWAESYAWLAGRLLDSSVQPRRRQDVQRAFEVTERYRARVLLETLQAAAAWPAPLDDRETALLRRRLELQSRILTHPSSEARARLREVGEQLERLKVRGAVASTTLAVRDPSTLVELEQTLAEDEALLSFQIAPWRDVYGQFGGGSWLFAVTRAGTRIYRLPGRAAIEPKITQYLGLFQSRVNESVAAASLYKEILAAAVDDLPEAVDKLVIVPDGALYTLPFGTLRPAADEAVLAARYQISVLPSATLWLHWRQSPREPRPGPALVLADPTPPEPSASASGSADRSWPLAGDARLSRLPGAREEGREIFRMLGEPSVLRIDDEASESFLKQTDLGHLSVLHFASHAIVDEQHPERSAVLLATGSPDEDGRLEMGEIVDLDLSGQLVVIAACYGASGNLLRGEGAMSLARAFFQAGGRAVVAGLWRLNDHEARDLLADFYRYLARGQSVTAALQAARIRAVRDGRATASWAGVVVFGDGSMVPLAQNAAWPRPPWWLSWVGMGVLAYSIILGIRLWRRQRR